MIRRNPPSVAVIVTFALLNAAVTMLTIAGFFLEIRLDRLERYCAAERNHVITVNH